MISIARTFAFNTSKELTELVIGELIIRNVVFNKKTVQGLHLFGKLIEKKSPCTFCYSFCRNIWDSTNTSDNDILEPFRI